MNVAQQQGLPSQPLLLIFESKKQFIRQMPPPSPWNQRHIHTNSPSTPPSRAHYPVISVAQAIFIERRACTQGLRVFVSVARGGVPLFTLISSSRSSSFSTSATCTSAAAAARACLNWLLLCSHGCRGVEGRLDVLVLPYVIMLYSSK